MPGNLLATYSIGEKGGVSLYAFVRNRPSVEQDLLGMIEVRLEYEMPSEIQEDWREIVEPEYGWDAHGKALTRTQVQCFCRADCGVKCVVKVWTEITINKKKVPSKTARDIYGVIYEGDLNHERRHAMSDVLIVKRDLVGTMIRDSVSFVGNADCSDKAKDAKHKYQEMVRNLLGLGAHVGDPGYIFGYSPTIASPFYGDLGEARWVSEVHRGGTNGPKRNSVIFESRSK